MKKRFLAWAALMVLAVVALASTTTVGLADDKDLVSRKACESAIDEALAEAKQNWAYFLEVQAELEKTKAELVQVQAELARKAAAGERFNKYKENDLEVVEDSKTGLRWARPVEDAVDKKTGLHWAKPKLSAKTYKEVIELVHKIGDRFEWRVPTLAELETIMEPNYKYPALHPNFPYRETWPSNLYWVADEYPSGEQNSHYIVSFWSGEFSDNIPGHSYEVVLVRNIVPPGRPAAQ